MSYTVSTVIKLDPKDIPEFLQAAKDYGMDGVAPGEEFKGPYISTTQTGPNTIEVRAEINHLDKFLQEMVPNGWRGGFGECGIWDIVNTTDDFKFEGNSR